MERFLVTNKDQSASIEIWAFDEEHAIERVEKLTDSKEFKWVKHVNDDGTTDIDNMVLDVFK